ncbi:MAG: threonine aldolase family protein [Sphaerochaetaceae bacterium]|jgi:threonine aldolase|nr:threonine aldolase family protein [Sphaerochaetaceae bacterium]
MKETFELRSDTFTLPSEGMRKAMYRAEVGDDVYHEDPTVNRLEEIAAGLAGKKHALFVSSGSMGNLIGLFANCGRGNEVICASGAHIIHHEIGSIATIAQVVPIEIDAPRGILTPSLLEGKVKPRGVYDMSATTMVEVENTIGGYPYTVAGLKAIRSFCDEHQLKIHMDGARLFNAALAEHVSAREFTALADDVTFCLSKGLGAPAGSILASDDDEFAFQAKRVRKMLGGGMRQIGFLAAAGIYALENNMERLADDHANAHAIAVALAQKPWAAINLDDVRTNIIMFDAVGLSNDSLCAQLNEAGILCLTDGGKVRLVTNLNLHNDEVPKVIRIIDTLNPKSN